MLGITKETPMTQGEGVDYNREEDKITINDTDNDGEPEEVTRTARRTKSLVSTTHLLISMYQVVQ
jgi:hypothetical protein